MTFTNMRTISSVAFYAAFLMLVGFGLLGPGKPVQAKPPRPTPTATQEMPSEQITPVFTETETLSATNQLSEPEQTSPTLKLDAPAAFTETEAITKPLQWIPLRQRFQPKKGDKLTQLTPGAILLQRATSHPMRINVLLFDLTAPEFDIKVGLGDNWLSGRTRTSYLVKQYGALAGVNGDLFSSSGIPQGLTMLDSLVAMPPRHRATFAWSKDRKPFIGYFVNGWSWNAEVVAPNGEKRGLRQLNWPCPQGEVCLYNEFTAAVPARIGDVKVVLGPSGRVFKITKAVWQRVEPGMQVLQGTEKGAQWLLKNIAEGDTLRLTTQTDLPMDNYTQGISAGPIILQNGKIVQDRLRTMQACLFEQEQAKKLKTAKPTKTVVKVEDEPTDDEEAPKKVEKIEVCEDFDVDWKLSHYNWVYMPRTGIGFDTQKQTLVVIQIDGYQYGYSRGIRQIELINLFQEFGVTTAMELDGGGSSTMVIKDRVINNPSDPAGERHVANGLLFLWNEQRAEPVLPPTSQIPVLRSPALRPE